MPKKHSNVYYVYNPKNKENPFESVEKAVRCKNDFGLDLFRHKDGIYEGRTGFRMISTEKLPELASIIERHGGIDRMNAIIEEQMSKTGKSPRYTRPDERKQDVFPPAPKKANIVFAKDGYGKKHYYYRFYDEDNIQLYTLNNENDSFRTCYIECEGYMLGIGTHNSFDEVLKRLAGYENGIRGEVERLFNECIADPNKWADICFANILGRTEEAIAHNEPIRKARQLENERRDAEREEKRAAEEQAAKLEYEQAVKAAKREYEQAIKAAERDVLTKQTLLNETVQEKSLIMQLFREHGISIPLKTQGWVINALHCIYYNEKRDEWSYRFYKSSRDSTVFSKYLLLLVSSIQANQREDDDDGL